MYQKWMNFEGFIRFDIKKNEFLTNGKSLDVCIREKVPKTYSYVNFLFILLFLIYFKILYYF